MNNLKVLLTALVVIGFVLQILFIKVEHEEKYVLADVLKGSASLMFVIIGWTCVSSSRRTDRRSSLPASWPS